ncbi:kinase-like protein [Dendrothele bispora CBS 962.96]|uniref:Kinase-like protein n=1 Tax=Dendrothele bispora (strain CBS 962.96) TaxID=1314807 RepID=A0A4S8M2Q2_DENBC|nr:kinase-like protein [Dendrothele bispora CBS 962.96]
MLEKVASFELDDQHDEVLFGDDEPGYHEPSDSTLSVHYYETAVLIFPYSTDTWRKPRNKNEQRIYEYISLHPRIVPFIGIDMEGSTVLRYQQNGDLWSFLISPTASEIPLSTRITWAIEIAQGIAHLHAKNVVWADAHFANVLVSDDFHMLLSDFDFSLLNPNFFHILKTSPPPVFACPIGYLGIQPTHIDIFGFAIMLFALLDYRFPFTEDLKPRLETQTMICNKHCKLKFDQLKDSELDKYFGKLLDDCFNVRIVTGDTLVQMLIEAHSKWYSETGQVSH